MCAFYVCRSLSSITLPSTVTEVDCNAFYNCSSLGEVVLRGVPREIGQFAFINCTSLERFVFPTISSDEFANIIQTHNVKIEAVPSINGKPNEIITSEKGNLQTKNQNNAHIKNKQPRRNNKTTNEFIQTVSLGK